MSLMVKDMVPNKQVMLEASKKGYSIATDIADILVQTLDIPFRETHKMVGEIVAYAENKKLSLDELTLKDFQQIDDRVTNDIVNKISFDAIIHNKTSFGGTAPKNVKKEAEKWLKQLKK